MFVIGNNVRGGKVYGEWPGLKERQLPEGAIWLSRQTFAMSSASWPEALATQIFRRSFRATSPARQKFAA